ncbi:hypothetical protein [Bradyrhizobium barranii]
MSSAVRACAVTLLDGDRPVARGMVAIDAEGVPPVVMFDGEAFLPVFETAELMPDVQTYRKARVLRAGDNFRPVMLTVVHR